MNIKLIIYIVIFFLCGAAIGLWLGQQYSTADNPKVVCRPSIPGELDSFYIDVLKVSDSQKAKILEIDKAYQANRDKFAERMHRANIQLADVITKEGYESDKIGPTVVEIHTAMGELQTLSLNHLAAIEKVLDPEQARLLKQSAVAKLHQN